MTRIKTREDRWLMTGSLVILATIALAVALAYTRTVMVPFVLALFIVSIVSPLLDFLVIRLKFPRFIAVTFTLVVVTVVIGLVCLLLTAAVQNIVTFGQTYSRTVQNMALQTYEKIDQIISRFEGGSATAAPNNVEDAQGVVPPITDINGQADARSGGASPDRTKTLQLGVTPEGLLVLPVDEPNQPIRGPTQEGDILPQGPPASSPPSVERAFDWRGNINKFINELGRYLYNFFLNAVGTVLDLISNTVFVTIFVIFLLAGRNPHAVRSGVYADIDLRIRRYIVTKLGVSAVTGILVWVALRLIGMELAVVFGILAFMLNFIPSIGSVISTFLPLPVALAQFQGDLMPILLVLLIPGAIQMVMGNGVEPKLMGEGLNLHPVTILLALSFWGLLWGVVGMFLAAPITAVLRIILMQFEAFQPLGQLMAGQFPVIKPNHEEGTAVNSSG